MKYKIKQIILTIFFFFWIILMLPMNASAADAKMKEGEVTYGPVTDTTATSSITWATEGFTVKKEKCLPVGDPTTGKKGEFSLVDGEKKSVVVGAVTRVTFIFPEKKAAAQFKKAGVDYNSLQESGGYVYLNGIMQVYKNGKATGRYYRTLKGIMNAEAWRNPNDFKDRFDIRLVYDPAPQPVEILFQETNSNVKTNIQKVAYLEQKTNTIFKTDGTKIPQTMVSKKTGRKYKLYRVHYVEIDSKDKGAKDIKSTTINPKTNYDAYVKDLDRIRKRSFEVPDGGLQVVAIYRWFNDYSVNNTESMEEELLEPVPTAIIQADSRGNEKFDSIKGIPTSESQYVNVFTDNYLMSYQFKRYYGTKEYTQINILPGATPKDSPITVTSVVSRSYSYWKIKELNIYELTSAAIKNYSLPGRSITLEPSASYQKPTVSYQVHSSNMIEPASGVSSVGNIKVRNDLLMVNGKTIMTDTWNSSNTLKPSPIPFGNTIGNNIFYQAGLTISATKENGLYESSGTVTYKQIANVGSSHGKTLTYEVEEINDVIIHTPVISNPSVQDVKSFNQMINPNLSMSGIVLNQKFKVYSKTLGDHQYIPGYGYRDYSKYTEKRQVKFPFDTYLNSKLINKNTWTDVDSATEFYLPAWVKEGEHVITFRSISINAVTSNKILKSESYANYSYTNYVAQNEVQVEVSGRVYGLSLYDISDYPLWRNVFRKTNSLKPTGNIYTVGTKDKNGKATTQKSQMTFPILNGSHPTKKNAGAVPTGYFTRYYLYTVGNMYDADDSINIKPTFYFVDKSGKNRQEVDLYYTETINGKQEHLVKMGSSKDKLNKKKLTLGSKYTSVSSQEIKDTCSINGTQEKQMKAVTSFAYTFMNIMLPAYQRTYVGSHLNDMSLKSMQKWYGEYYIPAKVHAVPKGYDVAGYANAGITYKEKFWLKDGFIVVNFDIETINNGKRHLSYINTQNEKNGYCNMWKLEGFHNLKKDYKNNQYQWLDGDYVLYQTDSSAADDYVPGGTH